MTRPREFDELVAVDHALETFWSGSYSGVSTHDLCEATGLSRSSLYNTFRSKSDLYRRSLERYQEVKGLERTHYLGLEGTGREALERLLLDVVAEQQASAERRTCLVINAAVELGTSDEQVARLARANLAEFEDVLTGLVARGQDDGSITSPLPARSLAAVIHAALNGAQVSGRVADDDRAARATLESLLRLL